jgi:hypothetical protein
MELHPILSLSVCIFIFTKGSLLFHVIFFYLSYSRPHIHTILWYQQLAYAGHILLCKNKIKK